MRHVTENKPCKTLFLDCNYSNSNHRMWQSCRPSRFTSVCCELDNQFCQKFCRYYGWLLDSKLPLSLLFVVDAVTWYTIALMPLLFLSPLADFGLFNVAICQFSTPKLTSGSTAACHITVTVSWLHVKIIFYLASVVAVAASTCCPAAVWLFCIYLPHAKLPPQLRSSVVTRWQYSKGDVMPAVIFCQHFRLIVF